MVYRSFIGGAGRKLTISKALVYAGLLVFLVPSVFCQQSKPDWFRQLTYDEIYNNTQYAQIRQTPKNVVTSSKYNKYSSVEVIKSNEIEYNDKSSSKLLVGFARDPFRYSVPEEDYARGVRYVQPPKGDRGKRGVFHLYNMIYCATGCEPLSYKGYGCYCGFLGNGRPTDGIDRCCKMHDQCYENIYCPFYTVYFQPYYWHCYHGEPLCALENYQSQNHVVNGCAARLCECDRLFAMCVRRYPCPRGPSFCHSSPIRLLQNILSFS
ncbi:hypothetical protein O3G_MSEX001970 [Manduca sexta]|uniref:Phospholipase A2 n=1 Tax=Manduca sexta TaxID=7130 RepID=A0A921YM41_MANSE|nr:hypothetical protein O3G_MSEX001970 [Manduca sexta]UXP72021.1 esterase [Manduca sexta]